MLPFSGAFGKKKAVFDLVLGWTQLRAGSLPIIYHNAAHTIPPGTWYLSRHTNICVRESRIGTLQWRARHQESKRNKLLAPGKLINCNVKQLLSSALLTKSTIWDETPLSSFLNWLLTTKICPGLKLCDGQLSTDPAKRRETEYFLARSSPESGTQSSGAAGEIDPITSAEGKVSILNDSLTTNKGRTRPGPQTPRVSVCFDISRAHSPLTRQWHGTEFIRQQNNFHVFPPVSLSCQPRLLTLSYIFQSIKRCWKCWLSSRWQVCTEQKARLEKLKIQLFVFPTIWSFCVRDSIFSFLCWLCHLLPLF